MNRQMDKDLNKAYGIFDQDHEKLRDDIMRRMANLTESRETAGLSSRVYKFAGDIIMKNRITKAAAMISMLVVVVIGVVLFDKLTTPAWAIGQSIKALETVETVIVSGEFHKGRTVNFNIRVKGKMGDWDSFRGYGESDEIVFMLINKMAYQYWRGSREIYSYDLEETKGKGIGSKLWYELMNNLPWIAPIAPTMVEAAKLFASDWEEVYTEDQQTGRDCVIVTGSYKPLSSSFQIVFDLETKLMIRAKYWDNSDREGVPGLNIKNIVYNKEVSGEIFNMEQNTGATVVNEEGMEKRIALWQEALGFDNKKQCPEAIEVYQQLYDKYPQFVKTPEALVMIAICYQQMGQYDKAIEYFEKVPREYSAPRYAILDAHWLLGRCYMMIEQDAKALESFKASLQLIDDWDPEGLRWPKFRELVEQNIEKINSE